MCIAYLINGGRDPEDLTVGVDQYIGLVSHLVVAVCTTNHPFISKLHIYHAIVNLF